MSLWQRLTPLYDAGEAQAIVRLVLEETFGMSLTDIVCGGVERLSASEQSVLERIMMRLEQGEPVQYVLGRCDFCGRTFHVEPGVLIPRPETEELVKWILDVNGNDNSHPTSLNNNTPSREEGVEIPRILDIGTGSGCIAISLALALPNAEVEAWDISDDALRIAADNARRLDANVKFRKQDILNIPYSSPLTPHLSPFTTIVSNPPYICENERHAMARNVLDYEPDTALFVPDDDPLRFYVAIADFACWALKKDRWLFFEINPLYVSDIESMLTDKGFCDIDVRTDEFGKKRMVIAKR